MQIIFKTIDGKFFDDEKKAKEHEKTLTKDSVKKKKLLSNFFKDVKDKKQILVLVGGDFDSGGCSTSNNFIFGTKEELIKYISLNPKYWCLNQFELRLTEFINVTEHI